MKALAKTRKLVSFEVLMRGVARYVAQIERKRTEPQYVAHPTTWLNQGRWDDEESPQPSRRPTLFEIATGRDR